MQSSLASPATRHARLKCTAFTSACRVPLPIPYCVPTWAAVFVIALQRRTSNPLNILVRRLNMLLAAMQKRTCNVVFPAMCQKVGQTGCGQTMICSQNAKHKALDAGNHDLLEAEVLSGNPEHTLPGSCGTPDCLVLGSFSRRFAIFSKKVDDCRTFAMRFRFSHCGSSDTSDHCFLRILKRVEQFITCHLALI